MYPYIYAGELVIISQHTNLNRSAEFLLQEDWMESGQQIIFLANQEIKWENCGYKKSTRTLGRGQMWLT